MPEHTLAEFAEKIEDIMPVVMKGFIKRQISELELCKSRITLPQLFILSYLVKFGPSKMKDLAHIMCAAPAAATGIINRLVRCGYVVRKYDPKDRRVIYIELTHKGTNLAKESNRHKRQIISDVFGKISKEERESYLSVLTHIRDVLANGASQSTYE